MRPLFPLSFSAEILRAQPLSAQLMNAYGSFCMVSERPIKDAFVLWHQKNGVVGEVCFEASAEDWQYIYLLDPTTFKALTMLGTPAPVSILHPAYDQTFSIVNSPLSYALEQVKTVYLDGEGKPEGPAMTEEHVIVRAREEIGKSTIRHFALNSIYYDEATESLMIPRADYLSMKDHRLQARTQVWRNAERAVALIVAAHDAGGEVTHALHSLRLLASASGHWSVWATVLWGAFPDQDLIMQVLGGDERGHLRTGMAVAPASLGYGPHNAFPGTADLFKAARGG